MLINQIQHLLNEFVKSNDFQHIYNEISLQIELGIFLKQNLKNYIVEFERNVNIFSNENISANCVKHEIDIVVYDINKKEKCAIELKYPRKKAYSKRMSLFLKDINFIEELKEKFHFQGGFVLSFVDTSTEKGFYKGKYKMNSNEAIFRSNGDVLYKEKYSINWQDKNENLKYYLLKI